MIARKAVLLIFVLFSISGNVGSGRVLAEENEITEGYQNENAVTDALEMVLHFLNKGVRVDYQAICRQGENGDKAVLFPRVKLQSWPKGGKSLNSVRHLFAHDRRVTVTQDVSGLVRVNIGSVRGALLRAKIPMVRLNPIQQYNPLAAMVALEGTDAFRSAVDQLNMYPVPVIFHGRALDPEPELPHLPSLMRNITIGAMLDQIADTFNGMVIYGECTNPEDKIKRFVLTFKY